MTRGGEALERSAPTVQALAFAAGLVLAAFHFRPSAPAAAGEPPVFLRETFDNLDSWKPLTFPRIKEHSKYGLVDDGGNSVLRTEAEVPLRESS